MEASTYGSNLKFSMWLLYAFMHTHVCVPPRTFTCIHTHMCIYKIFEWCCCYFLGWQRISTKSSFWITKCGCWYAINTPHLQIYQLHAYTCAQCLRIVPLHVWIIICSMLFAFRETYDVFSVFTTLIGSILFYCVFVTSLYQRREKDVLQ